MEPFIRHVRERRVFLIHQILANATTKDSICFSWDRSLTSTESFRVRSLQTIGQTTTMQSSPAYTTTLSWLDNAVSPSLGVPYTSLRVERPFLFDNEHSYPLNHALARAIGVPNLECIHELGQRDRILDPLLERANRQPFHEAYDFFVTSFCIPLLHSLALSQNLFDASFGLEQNCVTYRYQAFPTICVHNPCGRFPVSSNNKRNTSPVSCGVLEGHSLGCLTFHVPLTPAYGTNAMFVESHPGKENWHPLATKAIGMGFLYDGARCLSFFLDNTTTSTAVSLNFQVIICSGTALPETQRPIILNSSNVGQSGTLHSSFLCPPNIVEDKYSSTPHSTYYNEALIDLKDSSCGRNLQVVTKRNRQLLLVDYRSSPPFNSCDQNVSHMD
jgi:hypothetical protein